MNALRMNSSKPAYLCHSLRSANSLIKLPKRDIFVEALGAASGLRLAYLIIDSTNKEVQRNRAQHEEAKRSPYNTPFRDPKSFDREMGRRLMGANLCAFLAGGIGLFFANKAIKEVVLETISDRGEK